MIALSSLPRSSAAGPGYWVSLKSERLGLRQIPYGPLLFLCPVGEYGLGVEPADFFVTPVEQVDRQAALQAVAFRGDHIAVRDLM